MLKNNSWAVRQQSRSVNNRSHSLGRFLALLIIAFLSFLQWEPPGFFDLLTQLRWYIFLVIAGLVFIYSGARLNMRGARLYLLVSLLPLLGSLLSLFRTPQFDLAFYKGTSSIAPMLSGLLLLPAFSQESGRKWWLVSLLIAAVMWSANVQQSWLTYGEGIRNRLVGQGVDRNMVGLVLACASTALMTFALYGGSKPSQRTPLWKLARVGALVSSLVMVYLAFLTYSRSGFIITAAGVIFVISTRLLTRQFQSGLLILVILGLSVMSALPILQETNPTWFIKFGELTRLDDLDTSVYVRTLLVRKSWAIITANPIIGIGPGIFGEIYSPDVGRNKLPHNTYLGAWAEYGLPGLLGYVVWILAWLKELLADWPTRPLGERMALMTYIPFFSMLSFLDLGGLPSLTLLLVLCGFQYHRVENTSAPLNETRISLPRPRRL